MTRPRTELQQEAADLLADAVQAQGPGWRNTADSIRAGGYGNSWTAAALVAVERALRDGSSSGTD